jgi:hypothetical protein
MVILVNKKKNKEREKKEGEGGFSHLVVVELLPMATPKI